MIGVECPECGGRLQKGKCGDCGWEMQRGATAPRCSGCNETGQTNTFTHDTLVSSDAGRRYCAGCWILALKRRYEADLAVNKGVGPDGRTVKEYIAEFKAAGVKMAERFKPIPATPMVESVAPEERMRKATAELERFRQHLRRQNETEEFEVPF